MERVLSERETADRTREVTDEEVAFYQKDGWVKLDGLITPQFTAELLDAGRVWHQRQGKSSAAWNAMAIQPNAEHTVHHGYTVHGAPANTSDRPRLPYIFSHTPADT